MSGELAARVREVLDILGPAEMLADQFGPDESTWPSGLSDEMRAVLRFLCERSKPAENVFGNLFGGGGSVSYGSALAQRVDLVPARLWTGFVAAVERGVEEWRLLGVLEDTN